MPRRLIAGGVPRRPHGPAARPDASAFVGARLLPRRAPASPLAPRLRLSRRASPLAPRLPSLARAVPRVSSTGLIRLRAFPARGLRSISKLAAHAPEKAHARSAMRGRSGAGAAARNAGRVRLSRSAVYDAAARMQSPVGQGWRGARLPAVASHSRRAVPQARPLRRRRARARRDAAVRLPHDAIGRRPRRELRLLTATSTRCSPRSRRASCPATAPARPGRRPRRSTARARSTR